MAYNFFPKTEKEIREKLQDWKEENREDAVRVFTHLKEKDPTPINIDKDKPGIINVSRIFQYDLSIPKIKKEAGLKKANIKFGNGSSGNKGINNRGNLFETHFAKILNGWWNGQRIEDLEFLEVVEEIDETYGIKKGDRFKAVPEASNNNNRPIQYTETHIRLANPKGIGNDVGRTVTDITLFTDKNPIYLSLKYGSKVTFFNVGVRRILPPEEIKSGEITNSKGRALLSLFHVDHKLFCAIFNNKLRDVNPVVIENFNRSAIKAFLESGIGHNYHVVHKMPNKIRSQRMCESELERASEPLSLTIYYGGKTGKGRRVDIEIQTLSFLFKLNFRDTKGGDGYPTKLSCDFTYRKPDEIQHSRSENAGNL